MLCSQLKFSNFFFVYDRPTGKGALATVKFGRLQPREPWLSLNPGQHHLTDAQEVSSPVGTTESLLLRR